MTCRESARVPPANSLWKGHPNSRRDGEARRHAPDYFVRLADGRARVIDVRAADQVNERTAEAFAATTEACATADWEFEHLGVPDPVFMANVRWLARYRHTRCVRDEVSGHLQSVFRLPRPLRAGAEEAGDVLAVLPTLFHLLWTGVLRVDLHTCLLSSGTMVHTADGPVAALKSGVGTRGVLADRGRGRDGGRNEMSGKLSRPGSGSRLRALAFCT
ncbi:TnsA-like heteromeric transposase endonuclease subunit [Nonomuraea sp. CA-143628]|uniref:TnsA-like heteromeric transposase endonuclease subunit n=1 Tax=Nonomuraea sp. CA-143628 TaxID=3239997 RepID=UPI003D8CDD55